MNQGFDGFPIRFFTDISGIPRASGNEAGVAAYLERFAAEHGLFCMRDAANNVLIKKGGTRGRESEPAVLLQAHTDMVAEKNKGVAHDFATDPIRLIYEGNILRADATTLGADDGFGVAIMLAVLTEATDHPPLECLFTSSEEVGMDGAKAFDFSTIRARRLLNLDSAEEADVIVGCCGGQRTDLHVPITRESCGGEGLLVTISGLCGGHSGEDIHRGRANALTLMHTLLCRVGEQTTMRLSFVRGGDKDNAIPRECEALLAVKDPDAALAALTLAAKEVRDAVRAPEDAGLRIEWQEAPYDSLIGEQDTAHVLYLLGTQGGVLAWRKEGVLPQSSRNVASVAVDDSTARVSVSTRSPEAAVLRESNRVLERRAERVCGSATHRGAYPGWESPSDSPLVRAWGDAYREITGGEIRTTVIHAGLECGLICDALGGTQAIAVGCNIHDLHTPDERMELDSFLRIYQTVLAFLKRI